MKALILFLLFTAPVLAQNGFSTEKGKIVWEHFYSAAETDIRAVIKANDKMKISLDDDTTITAEAKDLKSTIDVNSVRLASDANFDINVTKVHGGYKVTVNNYVLLEKYGPSQLRIIPAALGKYYMENGKIRNSVKTQTDLGYVDAFLTGLFLPKADEPRSPVVTTNETVTATSVTHTK